MRRADGGVSDVVGSMLLVGITVALTAVIVVAIVYVPAPVEETPAQVSIAIDRGAGAFGTGDETVSVTHTSGQALEASKTRILVRTSAGTTTYADSTLGGAFSDGKLVIGETWTKTLTLPVASTVDVDVTTSGQGGTNLVAAASLTTDCTGDVTGPTVRRWTQTPFDVSTTTTGAVTVAALLTDDCAGVSNTAAPNLFHRMNDGSNPAYTNGGAMTLSTGDTWQGTIPDQTWSTKAGFTLEYYVSSMTDTRGNTATSSVQTDFLGTSSCSGDAIAPSVSTWVQSPSDVTTGTTGTVTITATLTDNCAGVDTATNPSLHHRVNDGSNPAFTNAGTMTRTTGTTWQGTIPDPTWGSQGSKTLQYKLVGMRDLSGNTGESSIQSDTIQVDCSTDTQAPSVQTWSQSPTDVKTTTTGAVTVTATLTDNCAGVDTAVNPSLHYRVNDGTNPAFTNGGAMTRTTGTTWQGTIPSQTWSSLQGKTLQYKLVGMTDLRANAGESEVRSDTIQLDCSGDTTAPTVQSVTQSPSNVNTATTGTVTVTYVLTDNCAGVDNSINPALHYRVNDGSNPSFTILATTRTAADTWQGTIPDPTWGSQGGKTLQYKLVGMRDLNLNTGDSAVTSDTIETVTSYVYVSSNTATTGTVTGFANAQSATDTNAEATLAEASATGGATTSSYAATTVVSSGSWASGSNGFASDNAYATTTAQPQTIEYGLADQAGTPGTITAVVLKAETSILGFNDDKWILQACIGATCSTASAQITGSAADTTITYDITSLKPGGGSWTWSDVNALSMRIQSSKQGGTDGTWRIDHAYVDVTYTPTTYSMSIQFDWTGVGTGTHVLELNYRVSGDTFNVQVWDGSSWTTRGTTLSAGTLTAWTYTLTANEYNAGAPRIRFVDVTPTGTTQGQLFVEYARVKVN